ELPNDELEDEDISQSVKVETSDLQNALRQVLGIERFADADTATDVARSRLAPIEGMEFESYDDAYNYYNRYAEELGFGIRVKSSWTKRSSKEKRGAVLCCNCEGFKTTKEAAGIPRKETRTGCLAMVRLRLVQQSNRWRLDEVKLDHNHLLDHRRAQSSWSHKKIKSSAKRKTESAMDVEIQTIKLYRTPAVNAVDSFKRLNFRNGDVRALLDYFTRAKMGDPSFFYIMDFNDEGCVRNIFWIDSRSRAAYGYFDDVIQIHVKCLSNENGMILSSFSCLNHRGQIVLLGSGFLADESTETYLWVLRAWLTCMSGRTPRTVVTDQCKALQLAVSEVFPRAHHRFFLSLVMQRLQKGSLVEVTESEVFESVLNRAVYDSVRVEEFETAWEEMIRHFRLEDCELLQALYEDREKWVPAYVKDAVLFGICSDNPLLFNGYLHEDMTLDEFFNVYELFQQERIQKEENPIEYAPSLRTSFGYEIQASELYSKEIFLKFQQELVLMSSGSLTATQVHSNGPVITYAVNERSGNEDTTESKSFEVAYDKVSSEVRCICSCFNFRGYLCAHALTVLDYNGVESIPDQYILTRWRKNAKRPLLHASKLVSSNGIDSSNAIQRYDHMYRQAMLVVAGGLASREHHMVASQSLNESLDKL
ncbi:hypothetical protein M569_07046, partial [Genlisea aurea]